MTTPAPALPPKWFIRVAWRVHRGLYRISGGRFLWARRTSAATAPCG